MNIITEQKYIWDIENPNGYQNRMGKYKTEVEKEFILNNIPLSLLTVKILDVGGGSGRFALELFDIGLDVTVLDLNKDALEILKKRNPNIETIHSDFMKFSPKEKYDVIICIEVVNYFNDFNKFLQKVCNILVEGGVLIFTAINKTSWRYKLRKFKKHTNYKVYAYYDYEQFLITNNFIIKEIKSFMWTPLRVNSNSILVPLFSQIENIFKLNKYLFLGPWLIFSVIKN